MGYFQAGRRMPGAGKLNQPFAHVPRRLFALLLAMVVCSPHVAEAGLGPENVFLVVNRASWASLAVANHYVELRQIPGSNILYLPWTGGTESIEVDVFREKILGPVLTQIEQRGLADQIDAIVYSSDFPYQVNLAGDLGDQKPPKELRPQASITSATYLWQFVMAKNQNAIGQRNNMYIRSTGERVTDPPTVGFRSWYGWGPNGEVVEAGGIHYMLSMMLAVTSGRGNSVAEAVGYLRRAAKADGSRPKGTVYYCVNDDVRSKTRSAGFAQAIDDLTKLGVRAEIVNGTLPRGKRDVAGLMTGVADFNWPSAQSLILPGAICEHLTSFGGAMGENNSQTPLSEFLRYGAAGASGSVVEPHAIQDKFPLAAIQVHYARGCALAEAFYQSIFGPYQLLIVGDPLCQPWARIPKVTVDVKPDQTLSGKVNVRAVAEGKVDRFQMFVDGQRLARRPAGSALPLETTLLGDGYHELRLVAIDTSPIETQGRTLVPIRIDNSHQEVELVVPKKVVRWGESLKLSVKAPGMDGGVILVNGITVAEFKEEQAEVDFKAREFGTGTVTIRAIGYTADKPPRTCYSPWVRLQIQPDAPLPALAQPKPQQLVQGMLLKTADEEGKPIQETQASDWLQSAGVKPDEAFGIEGYFEVPPPAKNTAAVAAADVAAEGVQQFQVRYTGDLTVTVDSVLLHDGKDGKDEQVFLPVALAPGMHRLRIAGRAGSDLKLQVLYGGEGTRSIDGKRFRQIPPQ